MEANVKTVNTEGKTETGVGVRGVAPEIKRWKKR